MCQGKRNRTAPAKFEESQATDRKAEDAHHKKKHNNKHARAALIEAAAETVFDLRVHQLIEQWWRDEEKFLQPSCLETNLNAVRKEKEARKQRHEPVADARAAAKDASIVKWAAAADKAIMELS